MWVGKHQPHSERLIICIQKKKNNHHHHEAELQDLGSGTSCVKMCSAQKLSLAGCLNITAVGPRQNTFKNKRWKHHCLSVFHTTWFIFGWLLGYKVLPALHGSVISNKQAAVHL